MENTRGGGGEETSPKHSVVLSFRKFDSENEQAPAAPLLAQCPEFPECYVVVLCNPRHSGSIRAVVRPFGQQTELGIKVCPEQTAFMEPEGSYVIGFRLETSGAYCPIAKGRERA